MGRRLRVRVDQADAFLQFEGEEREVQAAEETYLVALWLLNGVTIASLRNAALRIQRCWGWDIDFGREHPVVFRIPAELDPDDYWECVGDQEYPPLVCELLAGPNGVKARVSITTSSKVDEDRVLEIASSAGALYGLVVSITDSGYFATQASWEVEAELNRTRATVRQLIGATATVAAVVEATAEKLNQATAAAIRAGHADVLVGARESQWLEAKSALWPLGADGGKIELAQDVARFANATGGLIVVGAATKKRGDDDVVVRAEGIRPSLVSLRQLRAAIDARVYPPVEGLELVVGPRTQSGNVIVLIEVPNQPSSSKPFIVHGALVGRKIEGEFVSIVRRRGEASIAMGHREIHSWLVAGRRLMSGERRSDE
jgi:hypothetical protein